MAQDLYPDVTIREPGAEDPKSRLTVLLELNLENWLFL